MYHLNGTAKSLAYFYFYIWGFACMCVYMYTFMYLCIMHMYHMHAMHSYMCVHVVCTYICVLHTCSPCVHMCMYGWIPHARSARMYVFIHVYHMLAVHVLCVYICMYVCMHKCNACMQCPRRPGEIIVSPELECHGWECRVVAGKWTGPLKNSVCSQSRSLRSSST